MLVDCLFDSNLIYFIFAQFESSGIAGQGTVFYFDLPIFKLDETGDNANGLSNEREVECPAGSHPMVGVALLSKNSKVAPAPVSISNESPLRAKLPPLNIQTFERTSSEPDDILKGSATKPSLGRQLLAPLNTYSSANTLSSSQLVRLLRGRTSPELFANLTTPCPSKQLEFF
jgi:hypothetical protein